MLKGRGLIIADEQKAIDHLRVISYFRLANYFRPMERDKENHLYKPNSYFENAISLYYFDKKLRGIIFSAVQSIEIAHHARVWNRNFPIMPQLNGSFRGDWIVNMDFPMVKLYPQLCYLEYMQNQILGTGEFKGKLKDLFRVYPNVDISAMGFPKNWEEEPLWR